MPSQNETDPFFSSFDIDGLVNLIKSRNPSNIIVMVGAGASVAAGIPDFRTPGVGLYSKLATTYPQLSERPEELFSLPAFLNNPQLFYSIMTEMNMWPDAYKPTAVHRFIKLLADKKILRRCYTQNIDSLERLAGVPEDLLVEAHGSFGGATCLTCRAAADPKEVEITAKHKKEVPMCSKCGVGVVKPNVVFFGEALPRRFSQLLPADVEACDLLLVIGTSLQVFPFARIPEICRPDIPRVLINLNKAGVFKFGTPPPQHSAHTTKSDSAAVITGDCGDETLTPPTDGEKAGQNEPPKRDLFLGGDCQCTVVELVKKAFDEDLLSFHE